MRIEVLGPVRALVGGGPVRLRGASARTVLAALAVRFGSVVSTDQLAEALWGDDPPAGAVANIQSIVSRLRRGLGESTIETVAPGYRLVRDGVEVDLAELEGLLSGTDPDPLAAMDPESLDHLGRLLDSWEGEPLADVSASDWFLPDRSRLAELRLVARDRHNSGLIEAGEPHTALVDLRRAVAEQPLRETTQLLLAESLHRLGRGAEGLRVIEEYRRHLVEETGLDPSAAVQEFETRLLGGGSAPGTRSASGTRSRSGPRRVDGKRSRWLPPATPFVGRADELRRLAELLSENRVVSVVGTGGVGKSRLVMEFLASQTEREPATVLLASIGPGDSVAAALAAELGVESAPEALVDAIAGRLELEPTLVVLDNCEHVRDSARELVEVLAHRVQDLRVLATSRRRLDMPEERLLMLEPFPLPAEPDPSAAAVQLFCDRVARAAPHLETQPQDLALAVDICRLLGGLPLAMELAAARVHMLGLAELRNQLVRGRLPTSTGSRTMQEAVSWSLDLLGADARRLFAEACVFPSTFDLDALGAVSSLGDPLPALGELVDASMLSVVGDRLGHRYRILEPIRQVGSAEMPDAAAESYLEWVAGMGERVRVDFLERDRGASIELLLDHSDDFRHGLVLLAERGEDDRFAQLALALSYPLSRRPVSSLVSVILDRCPETPAGLAARVDLEWSTGRAEVCLAHVEQLLGMVEPDHPWVVKALGAACPAHSYTGDLGQMSEAAQRMVGHPAATDLEQIEAVTLWALGELYGGDVDAAVTVLEDNADVLALGSTALVSFVRAEVAAAQESDDALGWLERGATEARHTGDFLLTRMIEVARLAMLVRESEHGDALDLALDLVPDLTRAGLMPQAWMSLRHVATLLVELGEPATASLILDSAAASADAPELVGEAVGQEAELRRRIAEDSEDSGGPAGAGPVEQQTPLPVGGLWVQVEVALARHAQRPAATRAVQS